MSASTSVSGSRLASLDGLRGFAAVVVVIHHCFLTVAVLAEPYMLDRWTPSGNAVANVLIMSPLHVFWDGPTAVYVFFLLSGIVLTLPVVRASRFDWRSYYPRRLARIYFPAWVALGVGIVLLGLSRDRIADLSSLWITDQPRAFTVGNLANDFALVVRPGRIVTPLWSLQPELWFSILLPVYVFVAVKFRRLAVPLAIVALLVSSAGSAVGFPPMAMLPVFAIGALMATRLADLQALSEQITRSRFIWPVVVAMAFVLAVIPWLARGAGLRGPTADALQGASVLAALGLVVAALGWPRMRELLASAPAQYLGTISFSLYLIHEPIVIIVVAWLGEGHQAYSIPVALVLALAAAHVFYRFVERPLHLMSRRIGSRFARDPEPA